MHYAILISLLLLQGCSVLDFIKPNPGIAVDTEIVVGDKQEEIATGAVVGKKETTTTTNTAETIEQHYNTTKIDNGPTIFDQFMRSLMAFLLGWLAMPSANQMWKMISNRKEIKQD